MERKLRIRTVVLSEEGQNELDELKRENAALKQQLKEKDRTENERDEAEYPESANEESDTDDENETEDERSDEDEESDEDGVVEKYPPND
ncbi:hypothetical protein OUZ56_026052 [Daphnia magna]|uniref:Uncharacterized protein n=1 Tax=Daphnia magna TaxID=35525 RepID=A0ABQ9ZKQ6_9CRUS|nr:hypothetical protein OUZ56_026052 [Daphnia magna]